MFTTEFSNLQIVADAVTCMSGNCPVVKRRATGRRNNGIHAPYTPNHAAQTNFYIYDDDNV